MIPMLDLKRLHSELESALKDAFEKTLHSGTFINGPAVESFESELATHVGISNAIGVSSGTDALLVSLMALDVKPGDEIITTPYTFFATAGSISRLGARPVFADIELETFNIDPNKITAAITKRTVGIIPVHLFGQCADMELIDDIAEKNDLWVLEDAAQAIGAKCKDRVAGTMGRIGTFSFFPAKNLGALGDGGAVVTDDPTIADRVRYLREHGSNTKYNYDEVGGNFRLDALQAALLSVKLPHLAKWEQGRRRIADIYNSELGNIENLKPPQEGSGNYHVFNQYVIRSKDRDSLRKYLKESGVSTAIYYPKPLHLQTCFKDLGFGPGSFPVSEIASQEVLALPVDPLLNDEFIEIIVKAIKEYSQ